MDIAPIKLLSKVANKIAKKFTKRTGGSYVFDTEEKRIKALKWLPVENVWGKIRSTQSRSAITLMNGRKPDKVKEIALDMLLLLNQSEPLEKPN